MAQSPDWNQFLEAGMQFSAMTRSQARRRARQLVREGQLAQDRMQAFIEELLETSRKRADEFVDVVRTEVQRQMKALGLVSRAPAKKSTAKTTGKTSATKPATKANPAAKKPAKTAAKKAARKSTAKKGGTKASGAKKAAKKTATKSANTAAKKSP
jgi:polyhydroxyalkanoate synthesis regulator phasin